MYDRQTLFERLQGIRSDLIKVEKELNDVVTERMDVSIPVKIKLSNVARDSSRLLGGLEGIIYLLEKEN